MRANAKLIFICSGYPASLEPEMKCELHLAHWSLDIGDLPGTQTINCRVWQPEVYVIEHHACSRRGGRAFGGRHQVGAPARCARNGPAGANVVAKQCREIAAAFRGCRHSGDQRPAGAPPRSLVIEKGEHAVSANGGTHRAAKLVPA